MKRLSENSVVILKVIRDSALKWVPYSHITDTILAFKDFILRLDDDLEYLDRQDLIDAVEAPGLGKAYSITREGLETLEAVEELQAMRK